MKNLIFLFLTSLFLFTSCAKEKTHSIIGQWELKIIKMDDGTVTVKKDGDRIGSSILGVYSFEEGFEFLENGECKVLKISRTGEVTPTGYQTFHYEISDGYINFDQGNFGERKLELEFISADVLRMYLIAVDGTYSMNTNLYFERIN